MDSLIQQLEKFGLGLVRDGRVELHPHTPLWKEAFQFEVDRLKQVMKYCTLHHIGSTSIPGIPAKPILDILAVTSRIEDLDKSKEELEALGYEYKGEYGIPGRRYSVLYSQDKTKGYVHLHAFQEGSSEAQSHLLFRDFLRAHPERAAAYKDLKQKLIESGTPRAGYTEAKAPFIAAVLKEAGLSPKLQ